MYDWRAHSPDPTAVENFRNLDRRLCEITRFLPTSRIEMILDFVRGKTVLDIGAGEHDPAFYSPESWEHGRIAAVAAKTVAAELNPELCEHYRAKGYDFRCVDATSDVDLGERFERVFVGDVIEHVNDPVALLRFVKRHLTPDGVALFTTPNPFAPRFRQTRRRFGVRYVAANLEHTFWLSTSTMHEIAWRADMSLSGILWPLLRKPKSGASAKLAMAARRAQVAALGVETVYPEYAFELRPA